MQLKKMCKNVIYSLYHKVFIILNTKKCTEKMWRTKFENIFYTIYGGVHLGKHAIIAQ